VVELVESPLRTTVIQADPAATLAQREAFGAWTGQPFPAPAGKGPEAPRAASGDAARGVQP
jgi:hypothetical protein